ncbi:ATP-dependent helicase, partial [Micromonospora sp. NPDC005313]
MLVIHGLWLPGAGLALWAEDSTLPARAPRRPGRVPRERPHPFAADHAALAAALDGVPGEPTSVLLDLPTRAGSPLGSPELVRATVEEPVRGPVTRAGWRAPALGYAPDAAYALLRAPIPGPVGASLRHLCELADFAADLVARGRLLPVALEAYPDGVPGGGSAAT